MTPPLHFTVRARGVPGEGKRDPIEAAWQPGRLALRGPAGGGLDLSSDAVSRLRLGYERTKYSTFYTAWIWHAGGAEPVMMTAEERSAPAYGMAMRALARDVADRQGLDRIERGLSVAGALSWPIAALVIGLVFSAMALTVWADRGRVGRSR